MRKRNTRDIGKQTKNQKNPEPVSSTSRRGARAAYHGEYPRDFGPWIAYTVRLVSDTNRPPTLCRPPIWQGWREMKAPRPYVTYPFSSTSSVHMHPVLQSISIYIPHHSSYFFHVAAQWSSTHALFRIAYFKVQSLLQTFWTSIWHVLQRIGAVNMTFAHANVLNLEIVNNSVQCYCLFQRKY